MLRGTIREPEPHMEGSATEQEPVAVLPPHDQGPYDFAWFVDGYAPRNPTAASENRRVAAGKPSEDLQLW